MRYTYTHSHTYTYINTYTHTHTYTHSHTYTYINTYTHSHTYATAAIYRRWWWRWRWLITETTMYQWHCRTQPLCQCRPGQRLCTASNHQGHPGGTHQYRHALELE